ncbi:MAG TPA: preprotein translocase subunit SecE [Hyphomonadaceae bacterium]|nr:preprotein translocase subunit SecE [Hyphomonadaceae bacterium]
MEWWNTTRTFFSEVVTEMRKVTFPSRDEVVGTTVVVIITSFVFAIFLYVADFAIVKAYEQILKVFGS